MGWLAMLFGFLMRFFLGGGLAAWFEWLQQFLGLAGGR